MPEKNPSPELAPIGSHLPAIERLQPSAASRSPATRSSGSSATTPARRPSAPHGPQIGEPGCCIASGSPLAMALQGNDAEAAERSLRALCPPSLMLLVDAMETRNIALMACRRERVTITLATRILLLGTLAAMDRSSTASLVAREASRCLSLTASRPREATDIAMMAAALTDEMVRFSPDVVTTAFRQWSRQEKWWPTLAEILEHCHRLTSTRRALGQILAELP